MINVVELMRLIYELEQRDGTLDVTELICNLIFIIGEKHD